jgi:Transglycosylase SLT domain
MRVRSSRTALTLAPALACASVLLLGAFPGADAAFAQVYGYTDDRGVLILSNVPTTDRMRLIVDGSADEAGEVWQYSGQYDSLILKASSLFGVDSALVRAVIAVESGFNRYARSHKGARGLMQLVPDTGRRYGVVNAYDPWQNIRAGTAHLRDLIDEFRDLKLALAAYNAGATPVRRYRTIPPYPETRDYVRKVLAIYGVGSKVEIVKGNRVYSIGQPGGTTRVTAAGAGNGNGSGGGATSVGGSPLADLARRVAARRSAGAGVEVAESLPSTAVPVDAAASSGLYYRFVDAEGTVFITRDKPATYPYEVLQP